MTGWTAIIPIKSWRSAKSRLQLPERERIALARAFALDTIETAHRSPEIDRIIVVTAEPELGAEIGKLAKVSVLRDRSTPADDGLNSAIGQALSWLSTTTSDGPVVVIPADLATLTTDALDTALSSLRSHLRAHVPDRQGVGTTLLGAQQPLDLSPRYGPRSAHAHAEAGSVEITHVSVRVRLDVDDLKDLSEAVAVGVGPGTEAALAKRWPLAPVDALSQH